MSEQENDNRPSSGATSKLPSEKEKTVEKQQDDGSADHRTATPTKLAHGNKDEIKQQAKRQLFVDDAVGDDAVDKVTEGVSALQVSDAESDDSDDLPDLKERMLVSVTNSDKYPTTCKFYRKGKKGERVNLDAIYKDLPLFVMKVKVESSARQELEKVFENAKANTETQQYEITLNESELGRHSKEILDKKEVTDHPRKRSEGEGRGRRGRRGRRGDPTDSQFELEAYSLQKEPEDPIEQNYYFLSCEYMMKIYLPGKSISWFDYDERSMLIANIKEEKEDKRWIFIPSFRRAKIALLDWPKEDSNITDENTIRILVVRPSQFDEYVRYCGHQVPVICLPHDEIGAGYPRFWIQKIATWLKLSFIWMLDDSIIWFCKFYPGKELGKVGPKMKFGSVFKQIEDLVRKLEGKPVVAMSPRRFNGQTVQGVKKLFVCKAPQCAVYLNIDKLSSESVYYRPELPQFEDIMFAYECEKKGLKVFMDNRIHLFDCMWTNSGASSPSVKPCVGSVQKGDSQVKPEGPRGHRNCLY